MVNSNLSQDKAYKDEYQAVFDIINSNVELQNMIMNTKYMKHYYQDLCKPK